MPLPPVVVAALGAAIVVPHSPADLRRLVLAAGVVAPDAMLAAWVGALFPGPVPRCLPPPPPAQFTSLDPRQITKPGRRPVTHAPRKLAP